LEIGNLNTDTLLSDKGIQQLLSVCGNATSQDRILLVYDPLTEGPANLICGWAKSKGLDISKIASPLAKMHGQEPPQEVAKRMGEATLILGLTSKSMAHTQARMEASAAGIRYLSLPEYSVDLLRDPCLHADFHAIAPQVKKLADIFTKGRSVRVTTELGTNVRLNIEGRVGNYCPGFVVGQGEMGSPPDIEANVSPVETDSEGVVVIDGSIPYPGIGLVKTPVKLTIRSGLIAEIRSDDTKLVNALEELFLLHEPSKTRVLAEFGVGFNDQAKLQGIMLTDEGAAGTAHFGFGSNATVGGKNSVPFHLDFVFKNPHIEVDGNPVAKAGES
jgi:2,5-dihydroxypyridine 5,6-dioxygenase